MEGKYNQVGAVLDMHLRASAKREFLGLQIFTWGQTFVPSPAYTARPVWRDRWMVPPKGVRGLFCRPGPVPMPNMTPGQMMEAMISPERSARATLKFS